MFYTAADPSVLVRKDGDVGKALVALQVVDLLSTRTETFMMYGKAWGRYFLET